MIEALKGILIGTFYTAIIAAVFYLAAVAVQPYLAPMNPSCWSVR